MNTIALLTVLEEYELLCDFISDAYKYGREVPCGQYLFESVGQNWGSLTFSCDECEGTVPNFMQ